MNTIRREVLNRLFVLVLSMMLSAAIAAFQIGFNSFFSDPPNGEIIREFWQMERAAERRLVAVQKIRFPEDEAPTASSVARSPATR